MLQSFLGYARCSHGKQPGPWHRGGGRAAAQHCCCSFSPATDRIAVPGKKGREELYTPLWLHLVCALLTIHGTELHFQFFLHCQSLRLLPYTGSSQSRHHFCSALDLAQAAGKPEETHFLLTGQVWELPGNTSSFQSDTHVRFGNLWQPCSRL